MSTAPHRFATRCAHAGAGRTGEGENGAVQPAIVQSAIFDLGSSAAADAIFSGICKGCAYSRFDNRAVEALARALADLEGGAEAVIPAVSLGDPETLVTRPAKSSHRSMTAEARQHAGISDGLLRLAVALADSAALTRDMEQALVSEA